MATYRERHWHEARHAVMCARLSASDAASAALDERWIDACEERLACDAALIDAWVEFLCGCAS